MCERVCVFALGCFSVIVIVNMPKGTGKERGRPSKSSTQQNQQDARVADSIGGRLYAFQNRPKAHRSSTRAAQMRPKASPKDAEEDRQTHTRTDKHADTDK